jgi:deoxyadenosine/deoxycytidine kinase
MKEYKFNIKNSSKSMKTGGTDLLKLFYQDNENWSFAFENTVQLSRLKTFYDSKRYLEKFENENFTTQPSTQSPSDSPSKLSNKSSPQHCQVFLERSIFSSFNVFAQNSFEDGRLNQIEFDILEKYYRLFVNHSYKSLNNIDSMVALDSENMENYAGKNSGIPFRVIYIRADPEICFERLKKRDRQSEVTISLDYLSKIHSKYERWIDSLKENDQANLRIVNGNLTKDSVLAQIDTILNE